jgi:hypothetical protein
VLNEYYNNFHYEFKTVQPYGSSRYCSNLGL